jgi:cell division transport system permease protein
VIAVRPVPEAEVRATLEQWLGPDAAASADLPVPALIELELAAGTDPSLIASRVSAAAPGARLLAYRDQLGPLLRSVRALQWLALGLVLLMAVATAAAVVLATRGAFDTHRGTVEVMHGIGATDVQLAALFGWRVALDALAGGLAGAAAAGGILLLVAEAPGSLLGDLTGRPLLRPIDLLLLAVLPLAVTLLATLVARRAVLKALRASL